MNEKLIKDISILFTLHGLHLTIITFLPLTKTWSNDRINGLPPAHKVLLRQTFSRKIM